MIILPRQARDKHRKNSKNRCVCLQGGIREPAAVRWKGTIPPGRCAKKRRDETLWGVFLFCLSEPVLANRQFYIRKLKQRHCFTPKIRISDAIVATYDIFATILAMSKAPAPVRGNVASVAAFRR